MALERCCGAADLAEELAAGPGWAVTLAHPGYVARMKHNPDKSDYSDARMLAELCRAGFIPSVWLAPAAIRELRTLVRLRADLVQRGRAIKTRILGVLRAQRVVEPAKPGRWTKGWIAWLRSGAAGGPNRGATTRRLSSFYRFSRPLRRSSASGSLGRHRCAGRAAGCPNRGATTRRLSSFYRFSRPLRRVAWPRGLVRCGMPAALGGHGLMK